MVTATQCGPGRVGPGQLHRVATARQWSLSAAAPSPGAAPDAGEAPTSARLPYPSGLDATGQPARYVAQCTLSDIEAQKAALDRTSSGHPSRPARDKSAFTDREPVVPPPTGLPVPLQKRRHHHAI